MGKFPRKKLGFVITNCPDEDEFFDTYQEAVDSISIDEVEKWECVTCNELHDDRDDAYNCCE